MIKNTNNTIQPQWTTRGEGYLLPKLLTFHCAKCEPFHFYFITVSGRTPKTNC